MSKLISSPPIFSKEAVFDEHIHVRNYRSSGKNRVLFIHGAGQASSERMSYLAEGLRLSGIDSFMFDHSGHGQSSGNLSNSSLAKRLSEASYFVNKFSPEYIICSSMGGHTALQLSRQYQFKKIVFFAPGLFRDDCDFVEFGPLWSKKIREVDSFLKSNLPKEANLGVVDMMHIQGSEDATIPNGVLKTYEDLSKFAKSAIFLKLIGAPHNLHDWLKTRAWQRQFVIDTISSFLVA